MDATDSIERARDLVYGEAKWFYYERAIDLAEDDPDGLDAKELLVDHLHAVAEFLTDIAYYGLEDGEDDDPALTSAKQLARRLDSGEAAREMFRLANDVDHSFDGHAL